MSTLLEEPVTQRSTTPSERLRTTMAAARLSFTWLGVRKTLTSAQKHQAADAFGAEGSISPPARSCSTPPIRHSKR